MVNNMPNMPGAGVPLLGQQQQQQQAAIQQAVQQLSIGIYTQSAAQYVSNHDLDQVLEPRRMELLARDSQRAARAYFEGLGIAKFEDKPPGSETI